MRTGVKRAALETTRKTRRRVVTIMTTTMIKRGRCITATTRATRTRTAGQFHRWRACWSAFGTAFVRHCWY